METPELLRMLLALSIIFPIAGSALCAPLYVLLGPTFLHPRIKPSKMCRFSLTLARLFGFTRWNEQKRWEAYTNASLVAFLVIFMLVIPFLLLPTKVIGVISGTGFIVSIIIAPFILLMTARKESNGPREIFSNIFYAAAFITWFPIFFIATFLTD